MEARGCLIGGGQGGGALPVGANSYGSLVRVYNPDTVTPTGAEAPAWELRSYKERTLRTLLDKVKIVGFPTNKPMASWEYAGTVFFFSN